MNRIGFFFSWYVMNQAVMAAGMIHPRTHPQTVAVAAVDPI